jgi:PKD repeat protein
LWVSGAVTNGGVASGFGTLIGNTLIGSNSLAAGTLTPGNGSTVGTLVYSNNMTLLSGSTTVMKLDKGQTGSNDLVTVSGTATEAGTLTINNVGAPLVGGDTFKLFALATKSGNFNVTNLPALTGTLIWNTTQLGSSGIISVVLPPTITDPAVQAVLVGSNVVISTVVTGVPVPGMQWQLGGVNLTDGATGNGSTISGSTSSSLTIQNSQIPDSGQYCLIASNFAGAVTNCMTLEVTATTAAPLINGLHDQNVISPNSATFSAFTAGIPAPTLQWQDNGANILNETNATLVIPGVTFSLDGHQYCLIASNSVGSVTNCALLHVVVPPLIQTQPQNVTVLNTASATFSVLSTNGVPSPTFQWFFNNAAIGGATSSNYTISSVNPTNMGTYKVVVANVVGSVTSSNATLTVNSTMSAALTPANNATTVCYDTPLYLSFTTVPVQKFVGKINIYNVTNPATPVETVDTAAGLLQSRAVAGDGSFNLFPVIITTNVAAIYPRLDVLSSNQTYFVTVDPGTFADTNGALFAGITATNAWVFSTKPTGPANPNNVTVAFDGSGDFCTVQGALDSLPTGNVTPTLVSIRNGTYTEFVNTRNKNNVAFRGQSRTGTIVQYLNNNTQNGSTHTRMSFKVFSNDISVENLTIVNTTPQGGSQAEALMIDSPAARFILNNAEVDSRQDTILANVNTSQGYFYNSLVLGNFDYIWGGGNCYFNKCVFRTIPTASSYNLTASRTDTGTAAGAPGVGQWPGFGVNQVVSNGLSFVHCQFTRSSCAVSNITLAGANGSANGLASFVFCNFDITNTCTTPGYITPPAGVLATELVWEFGNSNLDNSASATFGAMALTNGDARLAAASNAVVWLNGWTPLLAPNIITNPAGSIVSAGSPATFSVVATGIPDPTDYQWYRNGNAIYGATGSTFTIPATTGNDNGTYYVIVSNPAGSATSASANLIVTGTAPTANFSSNPSTGSEPLSVTFTDSSTGSQPISLAWDFGDGNTATGAGGSSVVHAYGAGTYTVTLVASNYFGVNSLPMPGLIVVVDAAFEAWQLAHFGCTNCPAAAPSSDPDGDGQNNWAEYVSGTDPTDGNSSLHVVSVVEQGNDIAVTWQTVGGTTNIVQAATGGASGNYASAFSDVVTNIIGGSGSVTTTYVISGDATNGPARYYRVVLVP